MKKFIPWLALLAVLGCRSPESVPQVQTLRIGTRSAPDSLHPYVTTSLEGETIAARLYPTLFRELPEMEDGVPKLEPALVANYAFYERGRRVRLQLKSGLRWSDGRLLTAADVAYTFKVQKDPAVGWLGADRKQDIESVVASNDSTLMVRFRKISPFNLLDLNEGFIIPKHVFEPLPPEQWKQAWDANMVVFGPYKVGATATEEKLLLEPLVPGLPRLGFAFIRERETLFQMLVRGELDYAWPLPPERIPDLAAIRAAVYNDLGFAFLGFNPIAPSALAKADLTQRETLERLRAEAPHPIFGDPRVRKAMVMAVHREELAKRFLGEYGVVPADPWQTGMNWYPERGEAEPFNLDRAGALLDAAGWSLVDNVRMRDGVPLSFKVLCNASKGLREQYLLSIQQDLKALGVRMEIELEENERYADRCRLRLFDACFAEYKIGTRPDRGDLLYSTSPFNFTSWTDADEAIDIVRDATDTTTMEAGIARLQELFHAQMPFMMLYSRVMVAGSARKLEGQGNYLDPLYDVQTWKRAP